MALNSSNGSIHIINGSTNGATFRVTQPININSNIKPPLKVNAKCIYTGKLKNVSQIEIRNDRIILMNLKNQEVPSKFNITIPYLEMVAIRYCFTSDLSVFVIQPIYESYAKLSRWMKHVMTRCIPENFIMIHFEKTLAKDIDKIRKEAETSNPKIKFIEIRPAFAQSYLNAPNKTVQVNRTQLTQKTPLLKNFVNQEVIHLDDSDDDDSSKNETNARLLECCILKYPDNEPNPIILYGNDLNCLRDGHYLNDNIMNFYLKYYQHHEDKVLNNENGEFSSIPPILIDKIHIYDALFATHLLNNNRKRKLTLEIKAPIIVYTQEPFDETYQKVLKKWTKDIDIFSKDFLFIPLIKDSHWFLVILCYIGNLIPSTPNGNAKSDSNSNEDSHSPTIIFMDSLNPHVPRNEISMTIFKYLSCELKEKRKLPNSAKMPSVNLVELFPKVPQQQNYYDCGLFVLEYIERFLSNPEKHFNQIRADSRALSQWFEPKSLDTKRARIRQIILNLLKPADAAKLEIELQQMNLREVNSNSDYLVH